MAMARLVLVVAKRKTSLETGLRSQLFQPCCCGVPLSSLAGELACHKLAAAVSRPAWKRTGAHNASSFEVVKYSAKASQAAPRASRTESRVVAAAYRGRPA